MEILRNGIIKRLHVDKHVIARNVKNGTDDPAITIQVSGKSLKTRFARIKGPSDLMQPGRQLSCGARIWVETRAEVEYL